MLQDDILTKQLKEFKESTIDRDKEALFKKHLIEQIQPIADKLHAKEVVLEKLESECDVLDKEIKRMTQEILNLWAPFLKGTNKAELTMPTGHKLIAENKISISNEDTDKSSEWFMSNGYEGVMKFQIHHQTMQKIAREEYEKGVNIPGLKYWTYTKVNLK